MRDRNTKRLAVAAVALVLAVVGGVAWAAQRSDGPPNRACWGSVEKRVLQDGAPEGGAWRVSEGTDRRGDPTCTVRKGD